MAGWRRSSKFYGYREVHEFGRELQAWLDQVARELAPKDPPAAVAPEVFKISSALSLLSEALHDPDVKVRAVLMYSPEPNAVQREAFVRAYLDADRPADVLTWLQGSWDHMDLGRQSLLAEALGRLGRFEESAPIRQQMFERSLAVFYLQQWLEHFPEAAHADARSRARQLALDHEVPIAAAAVLLEIGDAETAEGRLLAEQARIDGDNYPQRVPLAKARVELGQARPIDGICVGT